MSKNMSEPQLLCSVISQLAESPVWDERRQTLFWCDILGGTIHSFHLESGAAGRHEFPSTVGCFGLCESGQMIVACGMDILLFDPQKGGQRTLASIPNPSGLPMRLNDGRVGPDGAFWVGSMHNVPLAEMGAFGALWRVTQDGVELIESGLSCPNGLAFSPDGSVMWHSDSVQKWVRRRLFDPATGRPGEGQIICRPTEESGRPDGGCADSKGTYWSAGVSAGIINGYDENGETAYRISMPVPKPTMCCFGGLDYRTMFITSHCQNLSAEMISAYPGSGGVWHMRRPVPGFAAARFDG